MPSNQDSSEQKLLKEFPEYGKEYSLIVSKPQH